MALTIEWMVDGLKAARLQVIFSERLYTDALKVLETVCADAPVEVKELPHEQAEELLLKPRVPAPAARRLAYPDALPGRPLELTLLARLELLQRAQRIRPQSSKLRHVRRAWERRDAAVRDLIPRACELVQRGAQ